MHDGAGKLQTEPQPDSKPRWDVLAVGLGHCVFDPTHSKLGIFVGVAFRVSWRGVPADEEPMLSVAQDACREMGGPERSN